MKTSYSVYGSPAFEASIEENLKHIATTISQVIPDSQLVAIILGGGYGRGEGGVLCKTGKEYLYNDYDLFLICKNLSYLQKKQYNQQVLTASHKLSEEIGIDVDFGPIKNVSELEGMPFTLMWYELKAGHKVIFGPADILQALPDYDTTCFPANEAVNLMLNRSVGLLLAEQKTEILQTDEEAPEFIQRNLDKAIMACGDAFLILNKTFHFSYVK